MIISNFFYFLLFIKFSLYEITLDENDIQSL